MANELTLTGSLSYADADGMVDSIALLAFKASIAAKKMIHNRITVLITEVAIPLGSVVNLGWALFKNLDPTNYIELRVATGGIKDIRIPPLTSVGPYYFGSGVTAPFAIANSASCDMEYLIVSA